MTKICWLTLSGARCSVHWGMGLREMLMCFCLRNQAQSAVQWDSHNCIGIYSPINQRNRCSRINTPCFALRTKRTYCINGLLVKLRKNFQHAHVVTNAVIRKYIRFLQWKLFYLLKLFGQFIVQFSLDHFVEQPDADLHQSLVMLSLQLSALGRHLLDVLNERRHHVRQIPLELFHRVLCVCTRA